MSAYNETGTPRDDTGAAEEPKRYVLIPWTHGGGMKLTEDAQGPFVRYDDYAKLSSRLRDAEQLAQTAVWECSQWKRYAERELGLFRQVRTELSAAREQAAQAAAECERVRRDYDTLLKAARDVDNFLRDTFPTHSAAKGLRQALASREGK